MYDDHATGDGNVTLTWDYSALALNEADVWFELGLIVNPGEDRTLYIDNLRVLSDNAPGDYNGDGNVDAADYTVWRDGDSPDSTAAGYNLWVANYDAASSVTQAVPEPSSIVLLGIASLVMRCTRRKKPVSKSLSFSLVSFFLDSHDSFCWSDLMKSLIVFPPLPSWQCPSC